MKIKYFNFWQLMRAFPRIVWVLIYYFHKSFPWAVPQTEEPWHWGGTGKSYVGTWSHKWCWGWQIIFCRKYKIRPSTWYEIIFCVLNNYCLSSFSLLDIILHFYRLWHERADLSFLNSWHSKPNKQSQTERHMKRFLLLWTITRFVSSGGLMQQSKDWIAS